LKKNKPENKWIALDVFYRALSRCSTACLFRLSKILAYFVTRTKNKVSRQTQQSIRLCFPELDTAAQNELISSSIQHTSCAFFELALLWYRPIPQVLKQITTADIDPAFNKPETARIIIAPHQGSWELLNLWLAEHCTLYSLYKPAKSAQVDQLIYRKRSRNDAILVPANTAGLRKLLKGLNNKSCCMILPDQRPAPGTAQIDASFLGFKATTSLLIKKLAERTDADIFIAAITRNLSKADYHLTINALNRDEIVADDLHSANYLNSSIEQFIQTDINQYQWSYRRFSRQTYQSVAVNKR